ncbi:hypothetical protein [Escherichia coli]|uniref:hypothetical protein n=1 Tax=Escherichia coli TaxID=562 RepID=UPI0009309E0B|nr:hypothetical protein [Escherichia coli]
MVICKKKCRDCGNAITHNTVCCPYCGAVDPFGYYRKTDRLLCLLTLLLAQQTQRVALPRRFLIIPPL